MKDIEHKLDHIFYFNNTCELETYQCCKVVQDTFHSSSLLVVAIQYYGGTVMLT